MAKTLVLIFGEQPTKSTYGNPQPISIFQQIRRQSEFCRVAFFDMHEPFPLGNFSSIEVTTKMMRGRPVLNVNTSSN
jgi:hypothetical protein